LREPSSETSAAPVTGHPGHIATRHAIHAAVEITAPSVLEEEGIKVEREATIPQDCFL
jgi:hypothetical protein